MQALPPQGEVIFLDLFDLFELDILNLFELDRNTICGLPQLHWLNQDYSRSAEDLLNN